MNKRDVILDFTTLLDVTLILLFFFILFSNIKVDDAQKQADSKMEAAESMYAEAEQLRDQYSDELQDLKDAQDREGENIDGILQFDRGMNIKLMLDVKGENDWQLYINRGEENLDKLVFGEYVTQQVLDVMKKAGYKAEDTIICDYLYDASQPGSLEAYRTVADIIAAIKKEYRYFYYSETDISIMEER